MEAVYRREFLLDDLVCDCFGRLKPSCVLYFVQEMAGSHVHAMALDPAPEEKGLFWVITRHRVQITRLPQKGERIRLETWPMPTTRVAFPRSVVAYDMQGRELFRSISLWVLMDAATRAMVLPASSGIALQGFLRGTELPSPHALIPAACASTLRRRVGFTDLDGNLHMNNCRYLEWVTDLLGSDFQRTHVLCDATMCYLAEAREGDELSLSWEMRADGVLHVDIRRDDTDRSTRIFAADLHYNSCVP